ncbi:MAG: hypothetical protein AAGA94_06605, partial [Pseudomonadota bacterium]
ALATKAARGAGAPAAQAALFGEAAALHLGQGRAAADLAQALDYLPGGPIMEFPLQLQSLLLSAEETPTCTVEMATAGLPTLAQSYLETLPHGCRVNAMSEISLSVTLDLTAPARSLPLVRAAECDGLMARMTELAARTFVPESDASRRAGAGAGLTDND